MEAMYSADSKIVVLQFVLGTVIVGGPKTGEFYEGICSNKVTNLRVDGVEIVLVDLQLRDTEEAPQ
jgi:hypothetical protein